MGKKRLFLFALFLILLSSFVSAQEEPVDILGDNDALQAGALFAIIGIVFFLFFFIFVGVYVYTALAWSTIARKLGYDKPWLAWIPIANFFLLPILNGKSAWWGLILFVPIVGQVYMIIWLWNIFEMRHFPGWLSLIVVLMFFPPLNSAATIGLLVIFGVVAWHDPGPRAKAARKKAKKPARKKAKKAKKR